MQDEINEKVIALSIRTTKLTAEMLQKSIRFMLSQIKKQLDKPVQHHGKQTLKQLMKQNAGVSIFLVIHFQSFSRVRSAALEQRKFCSTFRRVAKVILSTCCSSAGTSSFNPISGSRR